MVSEFLGFYILYQAGSGERSQYSRWDRVKQRLWLLSAGIYYYFRFRSHLDPPYWHRRPACRSWAIWL